MSQKPNVDRDVLMQHYLEAAEKAASTERAGNYQLAAELWSKAKKLALTLRQEQWCRIRSDYCYTWQGKRERRDD